MHKVSDQEGTMKDEKWFEFDALAPKAQERALQSFAAGETREDRVADIKRRNYRFDASGLLAMPWVVRQPRSREEINDYIDLALEEGDRMPVRSDRRVDPKYIHEQLKKAGIPTKKD